MSSTAVDTRQLPVSFIPRVLGPSDLLHCTEPVLALVARPPRTRVIGVHDADLTTQARGQTTARTCAHVWLR